MKYALFLALLMPLTAVSQEEPDVDNASTNENEYQNEIRVNALHVVLGFPEITYERNLTNELSVGLSAGTRIDEDVNYVWGITPFMRVYFGLSGMPRTLNQSEGFFFEMNGAVGQTEFSNYYWIDEEPPAQTETLLGLGFALGYKLKHEKWVMDVYGGIGRSLLENYYFDDVYPRFGVGLGRQF